MEMEQMTNRINWSSTWSSRRHSWWLSFEPPQIIYEIILQLSVNIWANDLCIYIDEITKICGHQCSQEDPRTHRDQHIVPLISNAESRAVIDWRLAHRCARTASRSFTKMTYQWTPTQQAQEITCDVVLLGASVWLKHNNKTLRLLTMGIS
jgi:hypothetical protein